MKSFKSFSKRLLKNRAGQGATEYILLLVVVVALVMMFKDQIKKAFDGNLQTLTGKMGTFNGDQ
jgi:Flp pilus assembly pilin Flp